MEAQRRAGAASAFTATLPLCDTSATAPGSSGASASPHIAAPVGTATIPFPFGPQTGSEWRAATSRRRRSCSAPRAISPKPAPYTTAPPQPSAPASSSTSGTAAAGIPTTTASGTSGRSDSEGKHSNPCADDRVGLHAPDRPGEAGAAQVEERLARVRVVALARPDDGDASRPQQPAELHQCSVRSTPRRSSARAMISRWISLVPSQMRSTRSSRKNRSATLVRM